MAGRGFVRQGWGLAALVATFCSVLAISQRVFAQDAEPATPAAIPFEGPAPAAEPVDRHSLLTAIEVEPGATCLSADKLIRRVERWLNQTKVDARIRVHVRGDDSDPNKVQFSIDRGDGLKPAVRRIDDAPEECEQLHSALALSIALAIDASIVGGGSGPIELPDDETLLEEEEEEEPAATGAPPYPRVALGVFGQLSTGLLTSDISLGAAGRIELGFVPWLDLRVGALYGAVSGQRVKAVPGTYSASIVAGRADVCGAYSPADVLRMLICASGVLGQFRTVGHDYTESREETSLWTAVGGGIEVQTQALDQLAFALSVDLLVPFARRSVLVLDPVGETLAERELTSAGIVIGAGAIFRVF
jgi:hypothetical protein